MLRILAQLLLVLMQLGIPGVELLFLLLAWIFPKLKIDLYVDALRSLRELEHYCAREATLQSLCPGCARDLVLAEIEFEIAACRSQIARLLLEGRRDPLAHEMIEFDWKALEQMRLQHRNIEDLPVAEFYQMYLEFVSERREEAERAFLVRARAYNPRYPLITEDTSENSAVARDCVHCSGVAAASPTLESSPLIAAAFAPLRG